MRSMLCKISYFAPYSGIPKHNNAFVSCVATFSRALSVFGGPLFIGTQGLKLRLCLCWELLRMHAKLVYHVSYYISGKVAIHLGWHTRMEMCDIRGCHKYVTPADSVRARMHALWCLLSPI